MGRPKKKGVATANGTPQANRDGETSTYLSRPRQGPKREWVRDVCSSHAHPQMQEAGFWGMTVFRELVRVSGEFGFEGWIPDQYMEPVYLSRRLMTSDVQAVADGVTKARHSRLLVTNNGYTRIDGWDRIQPEMAKTGAQRTAEYKERQRLKNNGDEKTSPSVTGDDRRGEERRREERKEKEPPPTSSATSSEEDGFNFGPLASPEAPGTTSDAQVPLPRSGFASALPDAKAPVAHRTLDALREAEWLPWEEGYELLSKLREEWLVSRGCQDPIAIKQARPRDFDQHWRRAMGLANGNVHRLVGALELYFGDPDFKERHWPIALGLSPGILQPRLAESPREVMDGLSYQQKVLYR